MFVTRRALFRARPMPFAGYRSIAPLRLYSTESEVPATKPATGSAETSTTSAETANQSTTKPEDASTASPSTSDAKPAEKPATSVAAKPAKPVKPAPKPAHRPAVKPFAKSVAKQPVAKKSVPPAPKAETPAVESKSQNDKRPAESLYVAPAKLPWTNAQAPKSYPEGEPNWEVSYYGISHSPVSKEQWEVLNRPIPVTDIEIKPDGVIYLPEVKYRRRLNEAFGPMGWGIVPRGETVVGDSIVTREYALIVGGRFVAQAQGYNNYFGSEQVPAAVEGAKSNALMRCCKDLGIASELWDPIFVRWFRKAHMEDAWVEHTGTKKRRNFWFRKGEVSVQYPYKLTK